MQVGSACGHCLLCGMLRGVEIGNPAPGLCRPLGIWVAAQIFSFSKHPNSRQDHDGRDEPSCPSSNSALKPVVLYQMSLAKKSYPLIGACLCCEGRN